ncbi:MAG: M10 family metallopeptidase C-terminal domain-containing protein [Thalassospira sp.]|nr:M10 family metallopeptidase C-terminal domain-containing protein [Thalassospira sp.]
MYVYTDEFSDFVGDGNHLPTLEDLNGGTDTLNAAAVTSNTTVKLGATATIDGQVISSVTGIENVYSGDGTDKLFGDKESNLLSGGRGNDKLYGGSGQDKLYGGKGKDVMIGGSGADTFAFSNKPVSRAKADKADIIKDFQQGTDVIDLSSIDASVELGGNDAFNFNGTTAFGRDSKGEIRYKQFDKDGTKKDFTMVYIDIDSDRGTEMSIKLKGLYTLTEDDFIL